MRALALILALIIVVGAFAQSCGRVVSSSYNTEVIVWETIDDPQAAIGSTIVVFVVALVGALSVMRRPRNSATIFAGGAFVSIVLGLANVDVYSTLLVWGILLALAAVFSYFGNGELTTRKTVARLDMKSVPSALPGDKKFCAACHHRLNLEDAYCTDCGTRQS